MTFILWVAFTVLLVLILGCVIDRHTRSRRKREEYDLVRQGRQQMLEWRDKVWEKPQPVEADQDPGRKERRRNGKDREASC